MSQASFAKRQREKAKKEKAAAKFQRRVERSEAPDEPEAPAGPPVDESALIAELASLHARFENDEIEFEDFAKAKEEITSRLAMG